jgi:hypothetical protein
VIAAALPACEAESAPYIEIASACSAQVHDGRELLPFL